MDYKKFKLQHSCLLVESFFLFFLESKRYFICTPKSVNIIFLQVSSTILCLASDLERKHLHSEHFVPALQIDGPLAPAAWEKGHCWGWMLRAASAALPGVRLGQKAEIPAAHGGAAGWQGRRGDNFCGSSGEQIPQYQRHFSCLQDPPCTRGWG